MELTYLGTFVHLKRIGNYTKTADFLGYSQSSVTTHIQRLEELYNGKLIVRLGSQLVLTPKGQLVYEYAETILLMKNKLLHQLEQKLESQIIIGTIETIATYILPKAILEFKAKFPTVKIEIRVDNEAALKRMLLEQEVDFIFIFDVQQQWDGVQCAILQESSFYLLTAPDYQGEFPESLILTDSDCTYRKKLLSDLANNNLQFNVSLELASGEAIKSMVKSQLGIGFLPQYTLTKKDASLNRVSYPLSQKFYLQLLHYEVSVEKYTAATFLIQRLKKSVI